MQENKVKGFLQKHVEKLILALAGAGALYIIVTSVAGGSVGVTVLQLGEAVATVKAKTENPPEPPKPWPPVPGPLEESLKFPEAQPAKTSFLNYRSSEAAPASAAGGQAPAAPAAEGIAPPSKVVVSGLPGVNRVQWWRAPGQGTDVRVDIFRKQMAAAPAAVLNTGAVEGSGFDLVAHEVESGADAGAYDDENIAGETPYVYALRSVRVTVKKPEQTTSSAPTDMDAYIDMLLNQGYSIEQAMMEAAARGLSSAPQPQQETVTIHEKGTRFRTAQVVSAIPLRLSLRSVTTGESGAAVANIYVERKVGTQWVGHLFNAVKQGDLIGDVVEKLIRAEGKRGSRQQVDLRTSATVLGLKEVKQPVTFVIRGQERTRIENTWLMEYKDKDGNTLTAKIEKPKLSR